MFEAIVHLRSASNYSQSRAHFTEKENRETADAYEARTWKNRLHVNKAGEVIIPPMAFKNCMSAAAQFMGIKIPGKGNNNYTKHFVSGVLVTEEVNLGIKADDVEGEWYFVPSNGRRNGGSRVRKCFPVIHEWEAVITFYILDEIITEEVFTEVLSSAGKFIGVGRFRPQNNGYYGRFDTVSIDWRKGK